MAHGGEYSSLDTEDDMLCCTICMEEYEDPRALPCLHTFCYKCLVELSMGGGGEDGPSDVTLQVAALKLEFASYVGTSSVPKQLHSLKCPLCSEDHPIPKDKGVAGFRQDFRIKKLLAQQRSREDGPSSLESVSKEEAEAPPEVCPIHTAQKLMYHCETCKADVCQDCWGSSHDEHTVKLLSKKVNDAKAALQQTMETSIQQISSHVNLLTKTKDSIEKENESVQQSMEQRFIALQEKLKGQFDQTLQEFQTRSKIQDKKMLDELQNLKTLKDTFVQIKTNLHSENLPQTSKAFSKYENMRSKMAQMGEELSQWSFTYSSTQVVESTPVEELLKALEVRYTEDFIGKKTEGGSKRSGRAKKDGKPGRKHEKTKGPRAGSKPPKESKAKEAKGEPAVPKNPSKLPSLQNLKWEHFVAQKKPNIECITATKSDEVFMTTSDKFSCFKTSPPKAIFEYDLKSDNVDAVTMVTSKAGSVEFLVKLDTKRNMLRFHSAKGKTHPYDYVSKFQHIETDAHKIVASAGHFVCYPYTDQHKVHVAFLALENETPDITEHGVPIQVPFARIRSMCTYVSNKGNPVLVCGNAFQAGKTEKSENALVAMTKQIVHWKVTFAEFDPEESNFDLRDMACDKDNVFVLNNRANVIYHVSKNGSCLSKVNIIGAPPKYRLTAPTNICLDARTKSVYISHVKDVISKFSY